MSKSPWLLPQGVNEILPEEATKLENLRRLVIDDLQNSGFQLVFPPMMEFIDSLIQGAGVDLTTQTFKVPDSDSLKTLGIRADMTPQIAQIDAHRLQHNSINRLCYIGTTLLTHASLGGSRELLQIGAEVFGDASLEADKRIIDAMVSVLQLSVLQNSNIDKITVSLSHIGIFTELVKQLDLSETLKNQLFDAMLRKSSPDIAALNATTDKDLSLFLDLLASRGNKSTIAQFADTLQTALTKYNAQADSENQFSGDVINAALNDLTELASYVETNPVVDVHIDLVELHGYRYHTGLTFQAFVADEGRAIAKGGRYAGISQDAEERAATGFSADLKVLAKFSS